MDCALNGALRQLNNHVSDRRLGGVDFGCGRNGGKLFTIDRVALRFSR
jgi:hypothetical protein